MVSLTFDQAASIAVSEEDVFSIKIYEIKKLS